MNLAEFYAAHYDVVAYVVQLDYADHWSAEFDVVFEVFKVHFTAYDFEARAAKCGFYSSGVCTVDWVGCQWCEGVGPGF